MKRVLDIMKIHSITTNISHRGKTPVPIGVKREKECVKERHNQKQNNYDNINTSIKSNPDARVSFKGSPFLHKAASFASDSPLVAEAIFALLITCGLRPISIMATASNEEDKEKCAYQAAKSISSGLVGLVMTFVVGSTIGAATKNSLKKGIFKMPEKMQESSKKIVKKGVNELKDLLDTLDKESPLYNQIQQLIKNNKINLNIFNKKDKNSINNFKNSIKEQTPKYYEIINKAIEEQKVIDNYEGTAKNVADKFFQPIFMPIRAAVTIAAIPILLKSLGFKKPNKKDNNSSTDVNNSSSYDLFANEEEKILFQPFSGAVKHENKQY